MQREIFFGLIRFCEQVTMCIRFAAIAGAAASPFAASREKHTGRSEVADVCCPACGNVAARRLTFVDPRPVSRSGNAQTPYSYDNYAPHADPALSGQQQHGGCVPAVNFYYAICAADYWPMSY